MLVGSRTGSLSKSNGRRQNKGALRKLPGPLVIAFIFLGACIDCEENPILRIILEVYNLTTTKQSRRLAQ